MADIITTFAFELKHLVATKETRVVVELPEGADELCEVFTRELSARWPEDDRHFEIDLQYAPTAANRLRRLGITDVEVRPSDPRLPLAEIVDKASALATERAPWAVSAVEILDEKFTHVLDSEFERMELRGTFVARVTQVRL